MSVVDTSNVIAVLDEIAASDPTLAADVAEYKKRIPPFGLLLVVSTHKKNLTFSVEDVKGETPCNRMIFDVFRVDKTSNPLFTNKRQGKFKLTISRFHVSPNTITPNPNTAPLDSAPFDPTHGSEVTLELYGESGEGLSQTYTGESIWERDVSILLSTKKPAQCTFLDRGARDARGL
ncbi:hypothetical protein BDW22DRAFT_1346313 [Trametopsis cervina]|nr:hypothetical protein BDW22DRAFT_1346313 [Trametopsis cervina]